MSPACSRAVFSNRVVSRLRSDVCSPIRDTNPDWDADNSPMALSPSLAVAITVRGVL